MEFEVVYSGERERQQIRSQQVSPPRRMPRLQRPPCRRGPKSDTRERVARYLAAHPGATAGQIAKALRISVTNANTVRWRMKTGRL